MLPLLYETMSAILSPSTLKYSGRIVNCTQCIATETKNGDYILTAEISQDDELADYISCQQFICVKSNPFDEPQFFEIYNLVRNLNNNISIKAKQIKHCCYNNLIDAAEADKAYGTPQEIWDRAKEGFIFENHFEFTSDITDSNYVGKGFLTVATIGDFMLSNDDSLLSSFGGEYHWDNFAVSLLESRGKTTNYCLRWGKNISTLEQTQSTETIKSHIIAAATVHDSYTDKDIQIMAEPYEIVGHQSKTNKLLLIDATSLVSDLAVNSNTGENFDFVKNACRVAAVNYYKDSTPGLVSTNIKIDVRAQLDEMSEIGLCDTVNVILNGSGTTAIAQVVKAEYDCLRERWNSLELGTLKTRLSDFVVRR